MGRKSVEPGLREKLVERMRAGEKAAPLAAEHGLNAATVQKWFAADSAEPRGIPPPNAAGKDSATKSGGRYKNSGGRRPITEQTAGMLVAGIFTLCAIWDGPDWILTTVERESLAGPLADSMRALPSPVADAVNTYAAPITFGTALVTVVSHKVRLRSERRERRKAPPPPPANRTNGSVAPPAPPVPPRNPPPAPFAAAPPAANGRLDPTLRDALEAARSNLTELDPMDEVESVFSS